MVEVLCVEVATGKTFTGFVFCIAFCTIGFGTSTTVLIGRGGKGGGGSPMVIRWLAERDLLRSVQW